MTAGGDQDPTRTTLSATTIDLAIRLGFIGLLGYWSFRVIGSVPYDRIVERYTGGCPLSPVRFAGTTAEPSPGCGSRYAALSDDCRRPVTWLGFGVVSGIRSLAAALDAGHLALPVP
jgi:hypothetical protein